MHLTPFGRLHLRHPTPFGRLHLTLLPQTLNRKAIRRQWCHVQAARFLHSYRWRSVAPSSKTLIRSCEEASKQSVVSSVALSTSFRSQVGLSATRRPTRCSCSTGVRCNQQRSAAISWDQLQWEHVIRSNQEPDEVLVFDSGQFYRVLASGLPQLVMVFSTMLVGMLTIMAFRMVLQVSR